MLSKEKKLLITGGAGYLGSALIKRLTEGGYADLRVVARNEGQLVKIKEKYPHIEVVTGDISDEFIAEKACQDVDGIFHLAAFKHIGLAEENVRTCVDSNVVGTINILKHSIWNHLDFIIGISTDKAAQVSGVYGATKMLMERLFQEYEKVVPDTEYRIVRYGNALYSTGSVLCKWKEKLEKGGELIITDPDSTRFYWTVDQAVDLIFECLEKAKDATPYCPEMKSIRTGDLLEAMVQKYSKEAPVVDWIGLQKGENMHEKLTEDGLDSSQTKQYNLEEIKEMI
jgi:UDP-N-acetylglucosamine 4,6-dehydratase/UDP-glucose 4-epimerase